MKKSIFISHATKDKELVRAFVELLEEGIGVPENEIFCSSLEEFGIPVGENFISYIKSMIQAPDIVIILLSPCYFQSNFCVSELGAAWALSHKIFPILVPPLTYEDVKDVLTGVQVIKIDDDIKYNELRDHLIGSIKCSSKSNTKWDLKRKKYFKQLKDILKNLQIPEEISIEEYNDLKLKLDESITELEQYEEKIDELDSYISELELCKDKSDVKKAKKKTKKAKTNVIEEFETLKNEINKVKNHVTGEVLTFILCEYYGKPYEIDFYNDKDEFYEAARYNYIDTDDGASVNWDNSRMSKLDNLLNRMGILTEEESDNLSELQDYYSEKYSSPLEPDNQEFWEEHYF